ncbi:hypothetical protein [Streptomyces sp. NPDC021020]|uniref:hypothetical protein n=1 Tax=Streptomyces sp. NPDC021020 TaxID=3365109 RepID=UPI0037B418EF
MSMRLLPWSGEGGKPSYLITDGEAGSVLTRLADNLEEVQVGMASDLLEYVDDVLSEGFVSETELRGMIASLCQSVRDLVRIANCRGDRLPVPPGDDAASRAADAVIDREIIR